VRFLRIDAQAANAAVSLAAYIEFVHGRQATVNTLALGSKVR
jgi:hypothetical protein